MGVGEASATSLAMLVHELPTNSLKHGAQSSSTGVIDITSTGSEEQLVIVWAETGGPVIGGTLNAMASVAGS